MASVFADFKNHPLPLFARATAEFGKMWLFT
jgi:hypothetical protein